MKYMDEPLKYGVFDFIPPSPMEDYIARALVIMGVKFRREVEFDKCVNPITGVCLRFDFVLFDHSVIIEYDGKEYHNSESVIVRDRIKEQFAKKHNITVFRMQGTQMVDAFFKKMLPSLPVIKLNCIIRQAKWEKKREANKLRKENYLKRKQDNYNKKKAEKGI